MAYLALAGLAVLCLYAWRYGHILFGMALSLGIIIGAYLLAIGVVTIPEIAVPLGIAGVIVLIVWGVT